MLVTLESIVSSAAPTTLAGRERLCVLFFSRCCTGTANTALPQGMHNVCFARALHVLDLQHLLWIWKLQHDEWQLRLCASTRSRVRSSRVLLPGQTAYGGSNCGQCANNYYRSGPPGVVTWLTRFCLCAAIRYAVAPCSLLAESVPTDRRANTALLARKRGRKVFHCSSV